MKNFIFVFLFLTCSIGLACPPEQLCKGDRLIDSAGETGSVEEVLEHGSLKVKFDRLENFYVREVRSVGKSVASYQNIHVGDRILDSSGEVGFVKEVFTTRKVSVIFDRYSALFIRGFNSIRKSVSSYQNIRVNDRIIDSSGEYGVVREIFQNGDAILDLDRNIKDKYSIQPIQNLRALSICEALFL